MPKIIKRDLEAGECWFCLGRLEVTGQHRVIVQDFSTIFKLTGLTGILKFNLIRREEKRSKRPCGIFTAKGRKTEALPPAEDVRKLERRLDSDKKKVPKGPKP